MRYSRRQWQQRATEHFQRAARYTTPHLQRRRAGTSHPVYDFLFDYYPVRAAHLERWHPGAGIELEDAPTHATWKYYITISRRNFISAIERANIVYKSEKGELVTFTISENSILIEGSSEIGDLKDVIDINKEGENLKIAFNSKYVLEGLKSIEQEFVKITFNGKAGACIIRPEDENIDYTYLVLPVLLQESQY